MSLPACGVDELNDSGETKERRGTGEHVEDQLRASIEGWNKGAVQTSTWPRKFRCEATLYIPPYEILRRCRGSRRLTFHQVHRSMKRHLVY